MTDSTAVVAPTTPSDRLEKRPASPVQRTALIYAQVAGFGWAKDLDRQSAVAVALWCQGRDIDPANELDVLGNKPVANGKYWKRKLGEMMQEGLVEDYQEIPVHHDERLDELGDEWAMGEIESRKRLRIMHGVPEKAAGAWVVRVKLPGVASWLQGCQWAGGGTGTRIGHGGAVKRGADADPIGEMFPVESALTRAYGKIGPLAVRHSPRLKELLGKLADTREVEGVIAAGQPDPEESKQTSLIGRHPVQALGSGYPDDEVGGPRETPA